MRYHFLIKRAFVIEPCPENGIAEENVYSFVVKIDSAVGIQSRFRQPSEKSVKNLVRSKN